MKKHVVNVLTTVLALCLITFFMTACSMNTAFLVFQDEPKNEEQCENRISVVCTGFAHYDWVKNVIKGQEDLFDVKYLLDKGTDMHNFQPTAADMTALATCDLLVCVGGESEEWLEDALEEALNKNMKVVNMMEVLEENLREEEIAEPENHEEHAGHEVHAGHEGHEHGDEIEYDEHVWLSLDNAEKIIEVLANTFTELDPENGQTYKVNGQNYINKIEDMKKEYADLLESRSENLIVVADRFPFLYLTEEFGIDYFAAFSGCSAETEASFEVVTFLTDKVAEHHITDILVLENSDRKIAEAVINNVGRIYEKENGNNLNEKNKMVIRSLDSLQSVRADEIEKGKNYLDSMAENMQTLAECLK